MNSPTRTDEPTQDLCAVVNRRSFEHTPDQVFAAITDPARLARWWGPAGFHNRVASCDLREGGDWHYVMVGPDGTEYPNHSRFAELAAPTADAPRRVVIEHLSGHHFVLTIDLAGVDGGTQLTWAQRFDNQAHRDQVAPFVEPANEQNLDRLQAELGRAG
jgi:hypothetical protein